MQLSRNDLRRRLQAEGAPPRPQSARGFSPRVQRENPSRLQVADARRLIESVCGKRSEFRPSESRRQSLQSPSLPPVETQARLSILVPLDDELQEESEGEGSKGTPKGTLKGNTSPRAAFDVFLEILRGASLHRAEVADVLGEEFVYVRKVDGPNGPYELELIPFSEISLENYMTLSPTGLTHYVGGLPVSFEPLQRWLNEREAYRSLRKIRFFQDFPAMKAFISWRSAGRRGRMAEAGHTVEERVFLLHSWFCSKYVTMRRIFLDFSNVRVMRSYFAQPQTLAEFQVAQENWQHDLFQKVAHQAQKVKLEVFDLFVEMAERVRRLTSRTDFTRATLGKNTGVCPVPGIIRAGMPKDDSDALEALGFSKDVSFAQRSRLRFECARLLRFARVVDLLIAETLIELMQASVVEINFNIRERPKNKAVQGPGQQIVSEEGWHGHLIFKIMGHLQLDQNQKCFTWQLQPDSATLYDEVMRWLRHGCGLATFFVQHTTCPELEAYRYMINSGANMKNHKEWPMVSQSDADGRLFEQLLGQEAWQESTGRLAATLEESFNGVQQKFKCYDKHLQWCYKCQHTDIRKLVQSVWNSGNLGELNQMLFDYRAGLVSLDQIPPKHSFRPLEVEISGAIAELKSSGARCLAELEEELPEVLYRCAEQVSHWISSKSSQLTDVPSSLAEFVSDLTVLKEVKMEISSRAELLERLGKLEQILDGHRLFVRQAIQAKCTQAPRSFAEFEYLTQQKQQQVQELREGFVEIFQLNLAELTTEVDLFLSEERVLHPSLLQLSPDFGSDLGEGRDEVDEKLSHLSKLQMRLQELQTCFDTYVHYKEVIAASEITEELFPDLSDSWLQLQRRLELWWTFDDWQKKCAAWLPADLLGVDLMGVSTEVLALSTRASQAQEDLPENPVAEELGRQLLYVQDLIPVLEVLQNPHLRARHWGALSQVMTDLAVGKDGKPQLTFGQAAMWNLGASLPELLETARRATQEHYLQVSLENLKETWGGLELPIVAVSNEHRDTFAFDDLQSLREELEDGNAVVRTALASAYVEVHAERVKLWQGRFEKVQELLDEISACQERWLALDDMFSVVQNTKKIAEVSTFQTVDSQWKAVLQRLQLRPNIVEIALDPQSSQSFRHLCEAMETISHDLMKSLRSKRHHASSRLGFLSDLELLQLLGTRHDSTVEHFARLCFPGVACGGLEINDEREITALCGWPTESLTLSTRVKLRNNPEETLDAIQSVMVAAMRQSVKTALEQAGSHVAGATAWAVDSELPSQVVLIAWETLWFAAFQESWSSNGMDGVKEHHHRWHSILQLRLLQRAARGAVESRKSVGRVEGDTGVTGAGVNRFHRAALLLLAFRQRQSFLEELLNARVESLDTFAFQKDLRYEYISESGGKVMVSLLKTQFPHGFEYLPMTRLVVTPQTERCWIALTQAFHLQMGTMMIGATDSGKSELTRGLATAFGFGFMSYRCSSGVSTALATLLVAGCAQGGCWLQLDGLSLLRPDVLGTLALQLRRLQEALRAQRETFDLEGISLQLKASVMISATMNSHSQPKPESLLRCLRPLALPKPDVKLLVEGLLLSEGFNEEPDLAHKVVGFWKHWAAVEGKDLGLRLLREVLSKAGALRRRAFGGAKPLFSVDVVESEIVAQVLESLKPRFGDTWDITDFERCELHLDVKESKESNESKEATETMAQLKESLTSQRGLVFVGPAGSGKSRLLMQLRDSFNEGGKVQEESGQSGEAPVTKAATEAEMQKLPVMGAMKTWHGKDAKIEGQDEPGDSSKEALVLHRVYPGSLSFDELFCRKGPLLQLFQEHGEDGGGRGVDCLPYSKQR
eukprot:symbB.v1.2.004917.t1/scaffold263.1/size248082/18